MPAATIRSAGLRGNCVELDSEQPKPSASRRPRDRRLAMTRSAHFSPVESADQACGFTPPCIQGPFEVFEPRGIPARFGI